MMLVRTYSLKKENRGDILSFENGGGVRWTRILSLEYFQEA